jgi:uncharacterized repeat protein (TIGR03943 family)
LQPPRPSPQGSERTKPTAYVEVLLLVALCFGLVLRWFEGTLTVYVNPAFTWLSLLSVGLLALVALPRLLALQRGEGLAGQGLSWTAYLVAGLAAGLLLLLPPRPMGSAALEVQGIDGSDPANPAEQAGRTPVNPQDDTKEWSLFEWTIVWSQTGQRQKLVGRSASLVGFVHHPKAAPQSGNEFVLARFVVRCCTADSTAFALPVRWPEAAVLQNDTWVRVEGSFQIDRSGPQERPYIEASDVTSVPRPINPYLSPAG